MRGSIGFPWAAATFLWVVACGGGGTDPQRCEDVFRVDVDFVGEAPAETVIEVAGYSVTEEVPSLDGEPAWYEGDGEIQIGLPLDTPRPESGEVAIYDSATDEVLYRDSQEFTWEISPDEGPDACPSGQYYFASVYVLVNEG